MISLIPDWTKDQLKRVISFKVRRRIAWQRVAWRRVLSTQRMLPNALIIGGQRCGTSSLYKYLGLHPEVQASVRKETQFFTTYAGKGLDWYKAHFPVRWGPHRPKVCFEASPDYLLDPRCGASVAALLPEARIIALLRDPVERAFSHYQHNLRHKQEWLSFAEALDAEPARLRANSFEWQKTPGVRVPREYCRYSYATRGLYADQLNSWLEHFPAERVLVVSSEEFFQNTAEVYARITRFLQLAPFVPRVFKNHSYTGSPPVPSETKLQNGTRRQLEDFFRKPNERLYALLGRDFGW